MNHIYQWIIVGLLGGILGKLLHPGTDGGGLFKTILLGVIGGLLGNFVAGRLFDVRMDGIDLKSIGIAAAGSLVLLIIFRAVKKK